MAHHGSPFVRYYILLEITAYGACDCQCLALYLTISIGRCVPSLTVNNIYQPALIIIITNRRQPKIQGSKIQSHPKDTYSHIHKKVHTNLHTWYEHTHPVMLHCTKLHCTRACISYIAMQHAALQCITNGWVSHNTAHITYVTLHTLDSKHYIQC